MVRMARAPDRAACSGQNQSRNRRPGGVSRLEALIFSWSLILVRLSLPHAKVAKATKVIGWQPFESVRIHELHLDPVMVVESDPGEITPKGQKNRIFCY